MELFIAIAIGYFLYAYGKNKGKASQIKSKEKPYSSDNAYFSIETYSSTYEPMEKSENKSKGRWISPDEEITVSGKTIKGGLFYYGGILKGSYDEADSSLVDDGFKIKNTEYTFTDSTLGYWPRFSGLSPKCRGAYIDWLASDRDMPDTPTGYLFIYFYGLERRIIKDCKDGNIDSSECIEVYNEILRLRSIFDDNYSFRSYSSNLLDYLAFLDPDRFPIHDDDIDNSIYSNSFKLKLSRLVKDNVPLPPEIAYQWIANHPDFNLRTPARRCSEEFKSLFMMEYEKTYPDGMLVKPNKTKLRLSYRPASSTLNYFEYGPDNLCDPSILSAPVNKLGKIADNCTDKLDAYSRYLGKKDTSKEDIGAVILLPNELIDKFEIPVIKEFQSWAKNLLEEKDGICKFKDFWSQTKLPLPEKINKKEQELVCNMIEKAGYSFAPHPALHSSKLNPKDPIVIFEPDGDAKLESSAIFDDIAIKLRLGAVIANADLKIHSNEISFLQKIIHANDNLTSHEKESLEAYLKWLLNTPSNLNGLKAALSKLRDKKDTEVVRKMLISVALSDGKIVPSEVKEIEKLYKTLGLDKSTVPADIHAMSSRKHVPTPNNNSVDSDKSFQINADTLNLHEKETKVAQSILQEIFKDDDEDEQNTDKTALQTDVHSSIESKAIAIYEIISGRDYVEREVFEKISSEHDFFVDAAIESINEWSLDRVNAPVIEDDGDIILDREIADELKELGEI